MPNLESYKTTTVKKFLYLKHFANRNSNTKHVNHKIYYLLCRQETFLNAYANISKNKGSLTKGVSEDTQVMKRFGRAEAAKICNKFKTGTYNWTTRRTWIPKPGKQTKRPIDIPTQEDRIVQEAIRGILESIYEPEFREFETSNNFTCTNFGFRPNKSCWDAVEHIKINKRTTYAIEGDIKQAYNNVNRKRLVQVLQQRIKDKKFLKLIADLLQTGVIDQGRYQHSLQGTPQGGIVSPLLFNIYMFTLDKLVYDRIILPMERLVSKERENPVYRKLKYDISKLRTESQSKQKKKNLKILLKRKLSIPSKLVETLPKKAVFFRYADDWVILVTGGIGYAKQIKQELQSLIERELDMELDDQKTKISRLDQGLSFLGFRIKMSTPRQIKRTRVLQKLVNGRYQRVTKRTTTRKITIIPDRKRVLGHLILKGFCDKDYTPKAKVAWILLDEYEIVIKFRHMIIGLYNYYHACDNVSVFSQLHYILKYSCAKTLARRRKQSIRTIFKTYSEKLVITKQIHTTTSASGAKGEAPKTLSTAFPGYVELKRCHTKKKPVNLVL